MSFTEPRDFFISFNKDHKAWADWVNYVLKQHGYSTYYQHDDSKTGVDFVTFMNDAGGNAKGFIALWSKAYSESGACINTEFNPALNRHNNNKAFPFIVLRAENYDCPYVTSTIVYSDLFSCFDEKKATDVLLDAVGRSKNNRNYPVRFPNSRLPDNVSEIAEALLHLGNLYRTSEDNAPHAVEPSNGKAFMYIEMSAELNNPQALRMMAEFSAQGLRDEKNQPIVIANQEKSIAFRRKAASLGDPFSLYKMGEYYQFHDGIEDYPKARKQFEKAIESGCPEAMLPLGDMYSKGLGGEKDAWRAFKMYMQAKRNQVPNAHARLLRMSAKSLQYLREKNSPNSLQFHVAWNQEEGAAFWLTFRDSKDNVRFVSAQIANDVYGAYREGERIEAVIKEYQEKGTDKNPFPYIVVEILADP